MPVPTMRSRGGGGGSGTGRILPPVYSGPVFTVEGAFGMIHVSEKKEFAGHPD